jgi:beta-galactosidase
MLIVTTIVVRPAASERRYYECRLSQQQKEDVMSSPNSVSTPKGIVLAGAIWHWPNVVHVGPADFQLARQHGYTHVKVDCFWQSLEPVEGVLEIDGLVRILDLAAEEGMPIIINLFGAPEPAAPHWAFVKFPDAQFTDDRGQSHGPRDGMGLGGTGTYPGLCWDSPQVRQATESFFVRLIGALKGHRGLAAWNVWAEPATEPARLLGAERKFCYCRHTQQAFREWMMRKYETVEAVNAAWGSTYTAWRQISPPGPPIQHHAWWAAWKTFLADRLAANMAWRSAIFRREDPTRPISAYTMDFSGFAAGELDMDDWKLQEPLDRYGVSFYPKFHFPGVEADPAGWMNHFDGIRSACEPTKQGQYFLGENQSAPVHKAVQTPAWQTRLSRLSALACGASAIWDWCLRLPYPGAWWASFGLARPDGTPGPWAGEIKRVNGLIGKIAEYWEMPRVHSRVAILFDPQSHYFCDALEAPGLMKESTRGFYEIAWDCNAPADFVHADFLAPETLARYETLFIPYQPTVTREMARLLKEYVAEGGNIVTEAGFGHHEDHGWAAAQIPHEMQEVFGCRTQGLFVEEHPRIQIEGGALRGARYWEHYAPTTGEVLGRHPDGSAGIVRNRYGKGTALIIGSLVGSAYHRDRDPQLRRFLSAYVSSEVAVENTTAQAVFTARLVHCREHEVLFLLNFAPEAERPAVKLEGGYATARNIETGEDLEIAGNTLSAEVPPRDALVLLLEGGEK